MNGFNIDYLKALQPLGDAPLYETPNYSLYQPLVPQSSAPPVAGMGGGQGLQFPGMPTVPSVPGANVNGWMPDWLQGAVGTKDSPGWGGMALGSASGLASLFMGMKQYGLAKESLASNKQQFQMQYDAQKKLTNSNLNDRQRARVASNPGAYESPSAYMAKYGVQ